MDDAARHAIPLYTLTDAARLRELLISRVEHAAVASGAQPSLRVVVVGGGATGVETAGALAELRNLLVGRDDPELDRSDITSELLARAPRLLSAFHPALSRYARKELERRLVLVRTDCQVQGVRGGEVLVSDIAPVPYDLLVWAPGVAVPDLPAYRGWCTPHRADWRSLRLCSCCSILRPLPSAAWRVRGQEARCHSWRIPPSRLENTLRGSWTPISRGCRHRPSRVGIGARWPRLAGARR